MKLKTLPFFFLFLLLIVFVRCSSETEDQVEDNSPATANYEYFRSAEMKSLLALIDTCTSPISLELLVPIMDSSTLEDIQTQGSSDQEVLLTRSSSAVELVTLSGYDASSLLFSNVQTTLSAEQSTNWGISAGTYYVSCYEIIKEVQDTRTFIKSSVYGDYMGVDPSNTAKIGYLLETLVPNALYRFTTYLYMLSTTKNAVNGYWVPKTTTSITTINIKWNFYAY